MKYDYFANHRGTAFGNWLIRRTHDWYAKELLAVSGGGRLLEVGPGKEGLRSRWPGEYVAADSSITICQRYGGVNCPANRLSFEDGEFDVYFAAMVLEHSKDCAEAEGMIKEANRVLRPGGVIGLVIPDFNCVPVALYNQDYTHNFFTSPQRVCPMLEDCGFEIIAVHPFIQGRLGLLGWLAHIIFYRIYGAIYDSLPHRNRDNWLRARTAFFLGSYILASKV